MFTLGLIQNFDIHTSHIEDTTRRIIRVISEIVHKAQSGTINIIAIDDNKMQSLNTQYRNKTSSTDILTFPYYEDFKSCMDEEVAGEIVISKNKVQEQADEKNITPEDELTILLIHGFVHMLGYDHETEEEYREMSAIEEKIKKSISL